MSCTGRYAEAWQYASFWCVGGVLKGYHVGGAGATLEDVTQNFDTFGFRANVGMQLFNVTQNTDGLITAVGSNTLEASGVTWITGDEYRAVALRSDERAQIEQILDLASGDIAIVLSSVNACNCVLSAWGAQLLAKINILLAGVFHDCPCGDPQLSDNQRTAYLEWTETKLNEIRDGLLDVCGGTGKNFPAVGWASQTVTEFASREIYWNDVRRLGV